MDWTNCTLEVKMDTEGNFSTKKMTMTPTLTSPLTEALEGLKLIPIGVGVTELPLNPPATRRPSAADDKNWRERDGPAAVVGCKSDGASNVGGGGSGDSKDAKVKPTLLFKDQRDIGNFITGQKVPNPTTALGLTVASEVKKVLPRDVILKMNGKQLGVKYEESKKIVDYKEYHEIKQTYFYRWLLDNGYFQNIGNDKKWKKPDFISNEGRIVDVLLTTMKKPYGWQFYAIKYEDIIFLSSVDFGNQQTSTLESHCGYVYREMITGGDPVSELINEFEKNLAATEVTFGAHQLLIVSETDGVDDKDNVVKIRAYKPVTPGAPEWVQRIERSKFLKFWGVSVIPGVKTLVLGHRDENQVLRATEHIPTDELWDRTKFGEKGKQRCYTFVNRLLDFIKEQFSGNDRFKVKLIKWEGVPRKKNERKADLDLNDKSQENTETKESSTAEPTKDESTEKNPVKNGGTGQESNNYRQKSGGVGVPFHPRFDLENASVICTTIVDPQEVKKVSDFILPEWFLDAAFKQTVVAQTD